MVERQDHHAIGNVLGSFLLQNQAGDKLKDEYGRTTQDQILPLQFEVVTLCKCIGEHTVTPWRTGGKALANPGVSGHVLLIDDMAEIWIPFLDQALPNAEVSSVLAPGFPRFLAGLVRRLRKIRKTGSHITPHSLIGKTEFSDDQDFILFLDLRLIPDGQARDRFYRKLAELGKEWAMDGNPLPWFSTEMDRRDWLMKLNKIIAGDEPHPEPLLAQLLSLLDPTLPIILFSSSHSSDLIAPLTAFGNLIVNFCKPTPAALPELNMADLKQDFLAATGRALRIKMARKKISQRHDALIFPDVSNCSHCEIFIDESGSLSDPKMNISGIAVCGVMENVQAFHMDLHNLLLTGTVRSPGVTSFHQVLGQASTATRPDYFFEKRPAKTAESRVSFWSNVAELAATANDAATRHQVTLFTFCLEFPAGEGTPHWLQTGGLVQEAQLLDIGYTGRMVDLLETIVFDILHVGSRERENTCLTLAVDLATRQAVVDIGELQDAGNRAACLKAGMQERWGVVVEPTDRDGRSCFETMFKSIEDRAPLRLVELALGRRLGGEAGPARLKIVRARGCLMTNWKHHSSVEAFSSEDQMPLPLHYLADFLATAVNSCQHDEQGAFLLGGELPTWFDRGFRILAGDDASDWSILLKDWDSGRRVEAIRRLTDSKGPMPSYVQRKVATWACENLSADELKRLFVTMS
jgi:hypothetical protein